MSKQFCIQFPFAWVQSTLCLFRLTLSSCNRWRCLFKLVFPKELAKLNWLSLLLKGPSGHWALPRKQRPNQCQDYKRLGLELILRYCEWVNEWVKTWLIERLALLLDTWSGFINPMNSDFFYEYSTLHMLVYGKVKNGQFNCFTIVSIYREP